MGLRTNLVKLSTNIKQAKSLDYKPLNNDIIVSLTSIPKRFDLLRYPIISLLKQTLKPDYIELNIGFLPNGDKPKLPDWLMKLTAVNINYVEDVGSATKYIPSIEKHMQSNPLLIIVDDDTFYYKNFIKGLVEAEKKLNAPGIISYRGHSLHESLLYKKSMHNSIIKDNKLHRVAIILGVGGYCIRPQYFKKSNLRDFKTLSDTAKKMDDIWISGHASINKIPKYLLATKQRTSKDMEFNSSIIDNLEDRHKFNDEAIQFFSKYWLTEEINK